jgi:hypothetical protein
MGAHVPSLPGRLQATQGPVHADAQQNPSAHAPAAQSPSTAQRAPCAQSPPPEAHTPPQSTSVSPVSFTPLWQGEGPHTCALQRSVPPHSPSALHATQLPAPSHTLPPSVQAVPGAASSAPHVWATHVTVWHVLLVPGQSAAAVHCGALVVLLVVVVLLVLVVVVLLVLDVAVSLVLDVVVRLLVEAVPPLAVVLEVPLVPPCPPVGSSRLSP